MNSRYAIPPGFRVYAIGDVHGHLRTLEQMHLAIAEDMQDAQHLQHHIVYLGDYIDRGPESAAVIDFLIERQNHNDGIFRSFLLGNHEHAMIRFMNEPDLIETSVWLKWGGVDTVRSYGYQFNSYPPVASDLERARDYLNTYVPAEHWEFLINLPIALEIGDYFFAHAGIDPLKKFSQQEIGDLTTIRQPFLSWHLDPAFKPLSKKIVHGHTVANDLAVYPHRIGVDTGLYAGGPLSAVVLEERNVRFLQVPAV